MDRSRDFSGAAVLLCIRHGTIERCECDVPGIGHRGGIDPIHRPRLRETHPRASDEDGRRVIDRVGPGVVVVEYRRLSVSAIGIFDGRGC